MLFPVALAAFPGCALAQAATELDEVVVTATRLPAIAAETPGARAIDAAAIEARGAVFAADILADVPGLSVVRSGLHGVAQVRMRGASPGKTLVLIDGVPVNDPAEVNGAFDFSALDLGDIARIEVLSGPQSSLWGSDAIGGVIAFTTRDVDGLRAEAEAGSFDTRRARLALGRAGDRYALSGSISRFETAGVSAADGAPEPDGLEATMLSLKGRLNLGSATLDSGWRWSESQADLDGFPPPDFVIADTPDSQATEQASGFVRLSLPALGLKHAFSLSAGAVERDTVSSFPTRFEAERTLARWQADGSAGIVDFAIGAEREDTSGSLSTGVERELGTTSVFGVARTEVGRISMTTGLRHDDTDDFGAETTGRAAVALALPRGLILSGAWGTGFKAPSISQAACDYCFSASPFPALRPETADSLEAALGWRSADRRLEGRITAYRLKVRDQIDYVFDPASFESVYINIDRTRTDGVEAEGRAALGDGLDLTLAYGWTDATDETTGDRLLRVPEHAGSATLAWAGQRLSGALTLRAEGDQDDFGGVREAFVTANLNAAYALNDAVTLTGRIENLADAHYQQVLGYGEPGRAAYVGVRLRY
jgi:vitamin B12 transporter